MKLEELELNKLIPISRAAVAVMKKKAGGTFEKAYVIYNKEFVDLPTFQIDCVKAMSNKDTINAIKQGMVSMYVKESTSKKTNTTYRYARFKLSGKHGTYTWVEDEDGKYSWSLDEVPF